jgi:hypothetical protein
MINNGPVEYSVNLNIIHTLKQCLRFILIRCPGRRRDKPPASRSLVNSIHTLLCLHEHMNSGQHCHGLQEQFVASCSVKQIQQYI